MNDSRFLQVFVTVPNAELANQIASQMVEDRLAACVQVIGPIRSVYRWQGNIESSEEWLLVLKTDGASWPTLRERIVALHSYEVPEILALPISDGHPPYLQWLADSLSPDRSIEKT
ncbi:MAG: divalent-cation tolerance protein CutA [Thermogutta sp.]